MYLVPYSVYFAVQFDCLGYFNWLFGMGFHKNTLRRIELVCNIVRQHYEPGRRDRCYKEVWRRYVYPVYPMCYRTFLSYIGVNVEQEQRRNNGNQLSLF